MKKISIIAVIAIVLVTVIFLNQKGGDKVEYKEMSFTQMEEKIQEGVDYTIIDVRTKEEYETGKILNAINIPLGEIEKILDIEKDKNKYLFIYCRSGNRSGQAVGKLIEMGYTNAYNVGGIIDYQK